MDTLTISKTVVSGDTRKVSNAEMVRGQRYPIPSLPAIFRSLLASIIEGKVEECENASGAMKYSHDRLPAANYWARKTEIRSSQSVSLL